MTRIKSQYEMPLSNTLGIYKKQSGKAGVKFLALRLCR